MEARVFDSLARVLTYPGEDYGREMEACLDMLSRGEPQAASLLAAFAAAVGPLSRAEREELYTTTFDMDPSCALEVGWHLFGENYERGSFLVRMREEMRRHGLPESSELPDHLSHVLRLMGRMEPAEAAEFAVFVLPALDKMLASLEGKGNPFEHVLRAAAALISALRPAEALTRS